EPVGVERQRVAGAHERRALGDARLREDAEQRAGLAELLGGAVRSCQQARRVPGDGDRDLRAVIAELEASQDGGREATLEVLLEHRPVDPLEHPRRAGALASASYGGSAQDAR